MAETAVGEDTGHCSGGEPLAPALETGLRMLGEFTRETPTIGAAEFARRLGMPRSTVVMLLTTLESMGFVERSGNDYRLGAAVLRLAFEYFDSLELTELGRPVLLRLCDEIRSAVSLAVRDHRSIVYVAKVIPPASPASAVRVGTRLPAHATVPGRILLEDLTLPELRALYPEDHLETFSERTPRTVLELFNMVQVDRQRGYVVGEGFYETGISSIAAAVRDGAGRVVAALGATIPASRIRPERIDELVQRVRTAADELTGLLTHPPRNAVEPAMPSVA